MKLSIIIPVLNERATVTTLLDAVLGVKLEDVEKELVIVEGGSTDGTREIVRSYETRPGVRAVYEDAPHGKGAAVRTGLALVTGDVVLIQDGDLEYSTDDYAKVLAPLREGRCDVVFGSRTLRSPQSWQFRRFAGLERFYGMFVNLGGVLFTGLFNLLYGTSLSDGATMFKVFKTGHLKALTLRSDWFDYDWEISAKLAKRGCVFAEVPVFYKARSRAEGKKIRFWRDGWLVLAAILRYRVRD
jgi:glycosyltransferase involved in cell wall biosynthesis